LISKTGFDNIDKHGSIIKSFSYLNAAVDFAFIEDELFLWMEEDRSNSILQYFLLEKSFSEDESKYRIGSSEGKEIQLPRTTKYFPLKENLE